MLLVGARDKRGAGDRLVTRAFVPFVKIPYTRSRATHTATSLQSTIPPKLKGIRDRASLFDLAME